MTRPTSHPSPHSDETVTQNKQSWHDARPLGSHDRTAAPLPASDNLHLFSRDRNPHKKASAIIIPLQS